MVDAGVCEPFGSQSVAVSNRSGILPNKVGRSRVGRYPDDIETEIEINGSRYYPSKKFDGYEECYDSNPYDLIMKIIERDKLLDHIVEESG